MYREIINIIDKKICELNRDKGAQFYKARHAENADEVIKWIGDNIDYKECTIHQYREYRDSPFESKLETPEGVIPVGSRLVKTKSGKLSYIPKELFDEDVFICLEDD